MRGEGRVKLITSTTTIFKNAGCYDKKVDSRGSDEFEYGLISILKSMCEAMGIHQEMDAMQMGGRVKPVTFLKSLWTIMEGWSRRPALVCWR